MGFMSQSVQQDYQLAGYDRGGTVVFDQQDGSGPQTIKLASWSLLTIRELAGLGGEFGLTDRKYSLGANQLLAQPKQGAQITDETDGTVWLVALDATSDTHVSRWWCVCRKAR